MRFYQPFLPSNAEIEVDGGFVGSTPSEIEIVPGNHTVLLKKNGFKIWGR
jgi:hypothetical protein